MKYNNIKVEQLKNGISLITVCREKSLNVLNTETLFELRDAVARDGDNSEVRSVLLTGAGKKAFIAGADIDEMKGLTVEEGVEFSKIGHEVTKLLQIIPKPTVAVVGGYALGGGLELAIACDIVLASENAVFGLPEVCLGITPGFGGTFRLSKHVGIARAKELIFTGRKVEAKEAYDMGIVNQVYAQKDLLNKAIEIGEVMSANSGSAIRVAKKLLNEHAEQSGVDIKMDAEAYEFGNLFQSADQKEGMNAFVEKRKPVFQH